jgi:hypothetical protein
MTGKRPTPPSPMEFSGPNDGQYPTAPDSRLDHAGPASQSEPWTVKRAYWVFRKPPSGNDGEFRTCPQTGKDVPLHEWHIRAVATRDPWPERTISSKEQETYYFQRVKDYVSWLDGETNPV